MSLNSLGINLDLFEKAAMPFPCNFILIAVNNLPRIFPMSNLINASFLIPFW